jgi:hypothetical protein
MATDCNFVTLMNSEQSSTEGHAISICPLTSINSWCVHPCLSAIAIYCDCMPINHCSLLGCFCGPRYGPVWVYLWKTTFKFTSEFLMLKSGECSREIGGQLLLTPNLLAFFDCCVVVAHDVQNVAEAEKRTPLSVLCPKLVAEHEHPMAKENRDSVMLANSFT